MSNWISFQDLLNRWGIEKLEIVEYLQKGLQPYERYSGRPLNCPPEYHLGHIKQLVAVLSTPVGQEILEDAMTTTEDKIALILAGEDTLDDRAALKAYNTILAKWELIVAKDGMKLNEFKELSGASKESAEKELEVIQKDDPDFKSWKWLTEFGEDVEYADDDFKKLFSYLDEAIFKEDDVREFEGTHNLDFSQNTERTSEHKENYFHLNGDYWEIGYKGNKTSLKNLERLRYIIHLIDNDNKEIYSHDLVRYVKGDRPEVNNDYAEMGEERLETEGLSLMDIYIPDMSKEEKDKLEYWANEIWERHQKDSNKQWGDLKRHFLNEYGIGIYESKKGLKFYQKARLKEYAEKARVNVAHQISKAIKDIENKLPGLGRHLRKQIEKGAKCIYRVDADDPITWDIRM